MSTKIKRLFPFLLLFLFVQTACQKGGSGKSFKISGSVIDESSAPIEGASVVCSGDSTTTDAQGTFVLENVNSNDPAFHIKVNAPNYFTAFKNLDNIDGSELTTQIMMIEQLSVGTIPTGGGQVTGNGIQITAPAGGFKNQDGTTYTGPVHVLYNYIDGASPNLALAMPGGDFAAVNAAGEDGGMRTYGFTATQFTDVNGNVLTANNTVQVGATIPATVANGNPIAQGAKAWNYNETTGKWQGETAINNNGGNYFYPSTTLYQNMDAFVQTGYIKGRVVCPDGSPLKGIKITVTNPWDKYYTYTNGNGYYRINAEANTSQFTVTSSNGGTTSVASPAPKSEITAPTITVADANCPANGGGGGGGNINLGSASWTSGGINYSTAAIGSFCTTSTDPNCTGGVRSMVALAAQGYTITIVNMPTASSGTFTMKSDCSNPAAGDCDLKGAAVLSTGSFIYCMSGSVTKTGKTTFTFTMVVADDCPSINPSATQVTVTGSGNYVEN